MVNSMFKLASQTANGCPSPLNIQQTTRRVALAAILFFVATLAWKALPVNGAEEGVPIDYERQVAPIFTKYCGGCHNEEERSGKLSLASYDSLLKGGAKGSVITAGAGDLSRMVLLMTGKGEPAMPPKDEERPTEVEIALIRTWIDQGGKGPSGASMPKLVTPQITPTRPSKPVVNALVLSANGQQIAVARFGSVELRGAADGSGTRILSGMTGNVNGVAFSKDGQLVAAAAGEPGLYGQAKLFDVASGKLLQEFAGHKDSLYAIAISPNGQLVATGGYDQQIKLWDVASGKQLKSIEGHNGPVYDLAFRPDGAVLASCSGDRTVKLWDVASGERRETLKDSNKELYTVAFSPDGTRLVSAGVDNRIRVWQIGKQVAEGENPLLVSQFAHPSSILRVVFSADGQLLVSTAEDRLIKVWDAAQMSIRATLPVQPDWVTGVAFLPGNQNLVVGRQNGTIEALPIPATAQVSSAPPVPLDEVPPEIDYGPQPMVDQLPKIAEVEPNHMPASANVIALPGVAEGIIFAAEGSGTSGQDIDLYRFDATANEQWIFETTATGENPSLDTKIQILNAQGEPVPRMLLRAVRDTEIEFRGMNGEQRGVRLKNYEEMLLNEYVYLGGDVIKQFQQRRGPDADSNAYPENGSRFAYFDTTSRAHALGEPGYVVVPYPVGTPLSNNGLPVFTIPFENDDQSTRQRGKNSQVTFTAPATGTYLVKVQDVRGFSSEKFTYRLVARRPVPDFKVTITGQNPTVAAGSGKQFTVKAERYDNFNGPITVEVEGLPPGFQATSPIVIAAGLLEAHGVINVQADAVAPTEQNATTSKLTAKAMIAGREVRHDVGNLGTIKTAEKPKLLVHLELQNQPAATPTQATGFPQPPELTITSGSSITCKLRIERNGFDAAVSFDIPNLPHGIIVDDIGLNGILIPAGQTERTVFLRSEPWVKAQTRPFFAVALVEGNQASLPLSLRVQPAGVLTATEGTVKP